MSNSSHSSIEISGDPPADLFPKWLFSFKIQATVIAIVTLLLYCNTFQHEYAYDDNIIILHNKYVLEGVSGIKDILTKDTYESFYDQFHTSNQLPGGRYRPLSIITFAIEQQFFGTTTEQQAESIMHHGRIDAYPGQTETDMHIRHMVNVFLYILLVLALLYFLRYIVFKDGPIIAFIAALLFAAHPLHTEVVANIKSRDEILSLLFICLTFIYAFKYSEHHKKGNLTAALIAYLLALLSKEYAITLVLLLPLAFYVFNKYSIKKSIAVSLPYILIAILYMGMRFMIVQASNNHPSTYKNLSTAEDVNIHMPTALYVALDYVKLLVYPHPLSSNYTYNSIPEKSFLHPLVWLSILIHVALIICFFYFLRKRHLISFAIAFYLLNLLLISNLFLSIGAPMGERLIFHSSLGFIIIIAYMLYKGLLRTKPIASGVTLLGRVTLLILVLWGFKTIARNKDWENDYTLYTHDVTVVPNSAEMNCNAGSALTSHVETETDNNKRIDGLHKAISFFNKSLAIKNDFFSSYLNRSYTWFLLQEPDSSIADLDYVRKLYPNYEGMMEMYFNVGVVYYRQARYVKALSAWKISQQLKPGYQPTQKAINILYAAHLLPRTDSI